MRKEITISDLKARIKHRRILIRRFLWVEKKTRQMSFFIFAALLIVCKSATAQIDDFEFQRSFIKSFRYPQSLRERSIPTYTNILIQISDKGAIQDISISDSAPKDFKDSFNKIKTAGNFKLLDSIVTSKKLNNNIIIPVFYLFTPDEGNNSTASPGALVQNYYVFNGKKWEGLSFSLKPIVIYMYKTLHRE